MPDLRDRATLAPLAGLVFLAAALLVDYVGDLQLAGVYATAAVLASISSNPRRTGLVGAAAVAAAVASGLWHGTVGDPAWTVRLVSCIVAGAAAILAAALADRYRRVLRHTTGLAHGVLDALASELTGARTVKAAADGFVGQAAARLGATSASIYLLDHDGVMRSVTWLGRGGSQADAYSEFRLDADLPGAVAARDGQPRHYMDLAAIEAEFPDLAGYYPDRRSLHVLPLMSEGQPIGLLAMTFPTGVIATDEELELLVSLGRALTAAVVRAGQLEASDAAAQRSALLIESSLTLSRTLDLDDTLAEVGRLLVPRFADWCAIHLLEDGDLRTAMVQHRDPDVTRWAQGMQGAFPVDLDAPTGAAAVVRTGEPELHPFIPQQLIEAAATSEEHAAVLRRLGMVSAVIVPLRGHDAVIGAVSLAHAESGRHYTDDDLEFLEDIAARAAIALDTAVTFRHQADRLTEVTKISEAAQRAILSPPPPHVGPFAMSARYVSAAEEAHIGGDLYEVVRTADRTRLLIGDVRGKGLTAVRTATVVLGEFRSAATQEMDLPALAKRLDHQLLPYLEGPEDFVTAALVDLADDGGFAVVLCGHPAPVHLSSGTTRQIDPVPSPPLGLGHAPEPFCGALAPGDRLLLFTDGLIEARTPTGDFQDPVPLWSLAATEPFDIALDSVLDALRVNTGNRLKDDLAMLLVEFDPPASADTAPADGRPRGPDPRP